MFRDEILLLRIRTLRTTMQNMDHQAVNRLVAKMGTYTDKTSEWQRGRFHKLEALALSFELDLADTEAKREEKT